MIRYHITEAKLKKLINALAPNWLTNATSKTTQFQQLGKYFEKEGDASWGEIKEIFMELQYNKCAYCERKFEGGNSGKIEHDIEHFRPKSKVRAWPTPKIKKELNLNYSFTTGGASAVGYFLLPYNVFNYITACKVCNTIFKSDYFPIASVKRFLDSDDRAKLKTEECLLIYPLGAIDVDPEKIITFQGAVPIPNIKSGHENNRARVTIDFFRLTIRDQLLFERALIIKALWLALDDLKNNVSPKRKQAAQQTLDLALSPKSPHTNCARAFYKTYQADPLTAEQYYDAAFKYLKSKGY